MLLKKEISGHIQSRDQILVLFLGNKEPIKFLFESYDLRRKGFNELFLFSKHFFLQLIAVQ